MSWFMIMKMLLLLNEENGFIYQISTINLILRLNCELCTIHDQYEESLCKISHIFSLVPII